MILVSSCIPCISLFLVSVPAAVDFRTLLTFDSPLLGIKYSWALYMAPLRGTLPRPRNPQEISKVLLPWPGLRNTFERYARIEIQRRMQRSSRCWTLLFSSEKLELLRFIMYSVAHQYLLSYRVIVSELLHRFRSRINLIRSNRVVSHRRKFVWKLIFFTLSQRKMT